MVGVAGRTIAGVVMSHCAAEGGELGRRAANSRASQPMKGGGEDQGQQGSDGPSKEHIRKILEGP